MKITLQPSEESSSGLTFTGEGDTILAALGALDADLLAKSGTSLAEDPALDLNELVHALRVNGHFSRYIPGDEESNAVITLEGYKETVGLNELRAVLQKLDHEQERMNLGQRSSLDYGRRRGELLAEGLHTLAKGMGVNLHEPLNIEANGDIFIVAKPANYVPRVTEQAAGPFGERFAALLSQFEHRTGSQHVRSEVLPSNGWLYMNHFEVERMLRLVAAKEWQTAGVRYEGELELGDLRRVIKTLDLIGTSISDRDYEMLLGKGVQELARSLGTKLDPDRLRVDDSGDFLLLASQSGPTPGQFSAQFAALVSKFPTRNGAPNNGHFVKDISPGGGCCYMKPSAVEQMLRQASAAQAVAATNDAPLPEPDGPGRAHSR